jgi:hypothetical protein
LGLSYDTPCESGYVLDSIASITEATKKEYYTLHVPVVEHYFANGVMHHNSGKTFVELRQIIVRAVKAPASRHAVLRFHMKDVKESVGLDTLPKVFSKCFSGLNYKLNKSDWYFTLPNRSEIWLGGLDDKERTEKVLGKEFATILLNECSQISWGARNLAITRLAQKCEYELEGEKLELPLRMLYDCNPPSKAHWAYQVFYQHRNPETKQPLADAENYAVLKMNPTDNRENLPPDYITELENQSGRMRRRFLEGEYGEVAPGALWTEEILDTWRADGDELPDMQRVIVAVDPSGASDEDNKENDEIGICVAGLGVDGNAYVLEDLTCKTGPDGWGRVATSAFERHMADLIVGESNYGGDMVRFVVQSAKPGVPFKKITASRGKVVRAEPIAALHEKGKIRLVGRFIRLEEELCAMTTSGYVGQRSPNRADAFVWAITELFPSIIKLEQKKQRKSLEAESRQIRRFGGFGTSGWAR